MSCSFQVTDASVIDDGGRTLAYMFGRTLSGNSVGVRIRGFSPGFHLRLSDVSPSGRAWGTRHAPILAEALSHSLDLDIVRCDIVRLRDFRGYDPNPINGKPRLRTHVFVRFRSLQSFRNGVAAFRPNKWGKRSKRGNDAASILVGFLRRQTHRVSKDDNLLRVDPRAWTAGTYTIPEAQMLYTDLGVRPCENVNIVHAPPSSTKWSVCDVEVDATVDAVRPESGFGSPAPCVTASYDIETYSASGAFPQWSKTSDRIICIGISYARAGIPGVWKRLVLCLGDTHGATPSSPETSALDVEEMSRGGTFVPKDKDDVDFPSTDADVDADVDADTEIRWYRNESDILSAFAEATRDTDALLGYNTFGFDNVYLSRRAELVNQFSGIRPGTPEASYLRTKWADARRRVAMWSKPAERLKKLRISSGKRGGSNGGGGGGTETETETETEASLVAEMRRALGLPPSRSTFPPRPNPAQIALGAIDDFGACVEHFGPMSRTSFFECSRVLGEVCVAETVQLTSSAKGYNTMVLVPQRRLQWDALVHFRTGGAGRHSSYSLRSMCNVFLGTNDKNKIDLPYRQMFRMWASGDPHARKHIAVYCARDCDLPILLDQKLCISTNLEAMARITCTPTTDLVTRGQGIKILSTLAYGAHTGGYVLNDYGVDSPDGYQGATVIDPDPGYYTSPVATLDFASLYPSIMRTRNLCVSTWVPPERHSLCRRLARQNKLRLGEHTVADETHVFVTSSPGILPGILERLGNERKIEKRLMRDASSAHTRSVHNGNQLAIKVSMNSFYGACGAPNGPLSCYPVAVCTTYVGRLSIDRTKAAVEQKFTTANGYDGDARVVYGDTDSVMVLFGGHAEGGGLDNSYDGMQKAWALAIEASDWVTKEVFRAEKELVLEPEKVYWPYLIFEKKKRYVGRKYEDSPDAEPKLEAKGVELARLDNCAEVRETYQRVLQEVMPTNEKRTPPRTARDLVMDVFDVLDASLQNMVCGNVPWERLVVTKGLNEYQSTNPPIAHCRVAAKVNRRLREGRSDGDPYMVGDRVAYVMVADPDVPRNAKMCDRAEDPTWAQRMNIPPDWSYYIDKQLRNPLTQLLRPFYDPTAQIDEALAHAERKATGKRSLMDCKAFHVKTEGPEQRKRRLTGGNAVGHVRARVRAREARCRKRRKAGTDAGTEARTLLDFPCMHFKDKRRKKSKSRPQHSTS
jgi:DNA polymerase elongation subunit (family B)